ncbi:Gfo/Idh/MocA family oxidoreductase [Isosphaeraceae bacterium EP7]
MAAERMARVRVGVIGLGRLWEARHRPALTRLSDRFVIRAVYDQVAHRAQAEAQSLGCAAPLGLNALVDLPDVDAIYLLSPQWFGLRSIELAAQRGKPIYCALPIAGAGDDLPRVREVMEASKVPFMPELARRFYPVTLRLRELLATTLGPPFEIQGQAWHSGFSRYGLPGPTTQMAPAPLLVDPGSYLIDWCRFLFGREPLSMTGRWGPPMPDQAAEPDFEGFDADFGGGALARVNVGLARPNLEGDAGQPTPPPGFRIRAERGEAWVEMPDRIRWTDEHGSHEERLPLEPGFGELLNNQFYRLVCGLPTLAPSWDDALVVTDLVASLRAQSDARGSRSDA